jgi:hypothetical protein
MDSFMLQDAAAKDRIRQAEEFLDPRESTSTYSTQLSNSRLFY